MVKKRSETVKMQTEPNSELPETPKNAKWETFRRESFYCGKKINLLFFD
jgi:hypothetical protein